MKPIKTISKVRLLAVQKNYVVVLEKLNGKYTLPGGAIEKKETKRLALLREVEEEIGSKLSKKSLSYITSQQKLKKSKLIYTSYFLCHCKGIQPLNMENHKFKSASWKPWYQVIDKMDNEDSNVVTEYFSEKFKLAN